MVGNNKKLKNKKVFNKIRIKIMENIFYFLGVVLLLVICLCLLNIGIARTEYNECLKWQGQSEKIAGFYLVEWQVDQCKAYNIDMK